MGVLLSACRYVKGFGFYELGYTKGRETYRPGKEKKKRNLNEIHRTNIKEEKGWPPTLDHKPEVETMRS